MGRSRLSRRGSRDGVGAGRFVEVAEVAERLAVLLAAGVSPSTVWQYLDDEEAQPDAWSARAAAAAARGDDVADALLRDRPPGRGDAWRGLAAAWAVSSSAGAPVGPALRSFAEVLRDIDRTAHAVEVALAGPVVSARIVLALPLVAVVLGLVLGFDVLGVLFGTPAGLVCLLVGTVLTVLGGLWVRRLTARARMADAAPGLRAELVAIAMSGGSSAARAVDLVDRSLDRVGLSEATTGDDVGGRGPSDGSTGVERILRLSRRAGVPAGDLLRSSAQAERARAATAGAARAARLGSLLLLPLGVCILPAFLVLGVVPMVLSLLSSTGLAF